MFYVLICISLTSVGIVALQFLYLAYLERIEIEHKKRIRELEKHCRQMTRKLADAQFQIAEQVKLLEDSNESDEEVWAEVIDSDR